MATRDLDTQYTVVRRHRCPNCDAVYYTLETIDNMRGLLAMNSAEKLLRQKLSKKVSKKARRPLANTK